nr:HAMP domain-containing histidine kinase [Chitinophagaceae bacterium]
HIGGLLSRINYKWKALMALLFVAGALTFHFGIIESICSLYLSAAVAFDFNNFFSLNYTTIIAFVVMFLILMAHLMLVRFFLRSLLFITGGKIRFVLMVVLAGGLLVLSLAGFLQYKIQLLFSLIWLLGFAWYICRYPRPAFPISSGRMVAWMLVYSISVGLLLGDLSDDRLRKRLYDLGKTLLMQNDQTSDYLVRFSSGSIRRLDWTGLIQQSADSIRSQQLRDSLAGKYFGGYLDRFDTRFYFYDADRRAVNNPGEESYESLNTLFEASRKEDGYPWLASFEESFDRFGYIMKFDAYSGAVDAISNGHVFVVVRSVVMRNALLAPELFRQLQDFAIDLPGGFSYAWYKNGRLVEQYRNYPFPSVVPPNGQKQSVWNQETDEAFEIWMNAGGNTILAISSARKRWLDFVSLVAYTFCSFLVIYSTLRLAGTILQGGAFRIPVFKPFVFTIQAQIRLTIIAILGISFLLVAYITINFFVGQFRKVNEERLAKLIQTVSAELANQVPASAMQLSEATLQEVVDPALQHIAKSLDADINFYDRTGKMVSSTQDVLFRKQVISILMHPEAFHILAKGSVHRHLMDETIGNLEYTSIYEPFRTADGSLLGYLQVPYFASQNELKQEISNFVVILINIIAFVFLLSGGLAVLISGSITRSFAIISEKMNQLRLSEKNERIEWTANNEIGNLVAQYNRMVDELESSAARLAQSERELAWREMARQVAHEIKNPLTPMKLNLQFLQKAISENHPNVNEISTRVAGNLVSQIDHLSRIAFEFSQFANIGNARSSVFDLQTVLSDLVMLYDTQEHLHIQWVRSSRPVFINADKTQMNRLFTNLLQNASEAASDQQEVRISLIETLEAGKVLIEVKDNGHGIPADLQPRIFMPNFTTKSSGTGLGLAICKAIVEKAGGRIWFNTSERTGTSFFVELPLAV